MLVNQFIMQFQFILLVTIGQRTYYITTAVSKFIMIIGTLAICNDLALALAIFSHVSHHRNYPIPSHPIPSLSHAIY